jgi:hypothetical protein
MNSIGDYDCDPDSDTGAEGFSDPFFNLGTTGISDSWIEL